MSRGEPIKKFVGEVKVIKEKLSTAALTLIAIAAATATAATTAATTTALATEATTEQSQTNAAPAEAVLSALQLAIKSQLAGLPRSGSAQKSRAKNIGDWYTQRDYQPMWVQEGKTTAAAEQTIYQLLTA